MRNLNAVRTLKEDLDALGLDGLNLSAAGMELTEDEDSESSDDSEDTSDENVDEDEDEDSDEDTELSFSKEQVESVAEAVFAELREDIEDDEIDYDVDEFEADLKEAIRNQVVAHLSALDLDESESGTFELLESAGEAVMGEATRVLKVLRGGQILKTRQQLRPKSQRMVTRRKLRPKRMKIARQKKIAGRKAHRKLQVKRRARAEQRESNERVSEMRSLLIEDGNRIDESEERAETRSMIAEAYSRIAYTSNLLAEFFEEFGEDEDLEIATVLSEMHERVGSAYDTLNEGDLDIAAHIDAIDRYGKLMEAALQEYAGYQLVQATEGGEEGNE